jgi:hypothetical protein
MIPFSGLNSSMVAESVVEDLNSQKELHRLIGKKIKNIHIISSVNCGGDNMNIFVMRLLPYFIHSTMSLAILNIGMINMNTLNNLINNSEFSYFKIDDFIGIKTPYFYPDGDIIDIFFKEKDQKFIITDLGETMRWLLTQSITFNLSDRIEQQIIDVLSSHKVERDRGLLITKFDNLENLPKHLSEICEVILSITGGY